LEILAELRAIEQEILQGIEELDAAALLSRDEVQQFRLRALTFLRAHEDHLTMQRLRRNQPLTATQIRFINEILDELTSRGVMDPARLYDPPFTDLAPTGPEDLFSVEEVDRICHLLDLIHTRAAAAQAA